MRPTIKLAIGAVMACGAALAVAGPAAAQVSFGIGVGPGYGYAAPAPAYTCYDAYGSYVSTDPYCNAYGAQAYVPPPVYYGGPAFDHRDWGRDQDRNRGHEQDRDHGMQHRGDRDHH